MGSMLILHIQLIAIDRYTKFLVMAISEPGKGKKKTTKMTAHFDSRLWNQLWSPVFPT